MARRIVIDPSIRDLDDWPLVAYSVLPERDRREYLRREQALRSYLSGNALADIELHTGIKRQQLYNLLRRCLSKHEDGRIYGFRGLLFYERVKDYDRREKVGPGAQNQRSGAAGALGQLLGRYPALRRHIQEQIDADQVGLTPSGNLRGLSTLHRSFLTQCQALGMGDHMYPLNRLQRGKRSLAQLVKAMINETFSRAARSSGADRVGAPWDHAPEAPATVDPLQVVEFDGHKLDIRIRVRLVDPFDLAYDLELERVWILALIDVASRAILGWHVVLAPEYDRHDVIRTLQAALQPRNRRTTFSINGLAYAPNAGFASQAAPSLSFAAWQWLRLDNARANLAGDTLSALTEFIGCSVDAGPVAQPNQRPHIERFFRTIAETLSHRLPGFTGSSPGDVRRRLADPAGDTELLVTFEELEELLDVTIANYNGSVHSALGGRSPLELLKHWVHRHGPRLRQLSEFQRQHLYMIQPPYECTVRGNKATGRRPHINFYGARYSGHVLTHAGKLIGTRILIYFDPLDLRSVQAFLPNGAELGALQANAPWHRTIHSLRLRREILRLKRLKEVTYSEASDPVAAYLEYKRTRKGKHSSKRKGQQSHRVAEAHRALQQSASQPISGNDEPRTSSSPAKPRALVIGDKAQTS